MAIADHPNILPDFTLVDVAIVLNGNQKLWTEKGLCNNILSGQVAIRGRMNNYQRRVALKAVKKRS